MTWPYTHHNWSYNCRVKQPELSVNQQAAGRACCVDGKPAASGMQWGARAKRPPALISRRTPRQPCSLWLESSCVSKAASFSVTASTSLDLYPRCKGHRNDGCHQCLAYLISQALSAEMWRYVLRQWLPFYFVLCNHTGGSYVTGVDHVFPICWEDSKNFSLSISKFVIGSEEW